MKFCNCRRTLDIYSQGLLIRPNVITLTSLLNLGQKVITFRTFLHLGLLQMHRLLDFKYGTPECILYLL